MRNRLLRRFCLAAAVLFIAATGCGRKSYSVGQVDGVITMNGKPLNSVLIQFMPDPQKKSKGPTSTAETGADGKFHLQYVVPGRTSRNDGAAVGWHRVTIADLLQQPAPQGQAPKPSRIPDQYREVNNTPLRVEVKSGQQTVQLSVEP
jgi:hypothetical protein